MQIIKNIRIFKSLFVKLIASFLLIIVILSSFYYFAYRFYMDSIEKEIIKNANERLNSVGSNLDEYFSDIKTVLTSVGVDSAIRLILIKPSINDYDIWQLSKQLNSIIGDKLDYCNVFLYTEKSDYIITPKSTLNKQSYFNTFFNNPVYNEHFWSKELKKPFAYNIFPSSEFTCFDINRQSRFYIPLDFKPILFSNSIMIAYIDIHALINTVDKNFTENLYIQNNNGEMIFSKDFQLDLSSVASVEPGNYVNTDKGYLFSMRSSSTGLTYYKLIPHKEVREQLKKTNILFVVFIILACMLSLVISIYISMKFNNSFRQITSIISKSDMVRIKGKDNAVPTDLIYIKNRIQSMVADNMAHIEENKVKSSALNTYFYQSRLKNIQTKENTFKDQIFIKNDYAIIYFKIHSAEGRNESISNQEIKA